MSDEVVTLDLPTRRWARAVATALSVVWLTAAVLVARWVAADAASHGGQPDRGDMLAVGALVLLLMIMILLAREVSDARLTYTPEQLRFHAGGGTSVRWTRIASIDPGRPGRPVRLLLRGNDREETVPGSRWLTAGQREELVADLERRRRAARRR